MGTLRGACVQAMLWHSLGRALVTLWQQCLLRGARLRRGARAILHDRRPAKMVCDSLLVLRCLSFSPELSF